MNTMFLSDHIIQALGATLLQSLWQGLLIVLILRLVLYAVPRKNVQLKYWLSIVALCSLIFWVGYTFSDEVLPLLESSSLADRVHINSSLSVNASLSEWYGISVSQYKNKLLSGAQPYMSGFVMIWMLGVVIFLLRLQGSIFYLRRLKSLGTKPAPATWQDKLDVLATKLSITVPVRLIESSLAEVPMVIGHLKPVILVPVGLLSGLSPQEVEAILAHELAHVKRFDYLINIVQTVVESVLFFNPAVWLISQTIRKHREHCCDDIAVACCGNQLEYAYALSNMGAWSINSPSLGMGLFKNQNELMARIKRLVYPQMGTHTIKEKLVPGIILTVTVVCLSWYSHKVQAQWMPVNPPSPNTKVPISPKVMLDTIPKVEKFNSDHQLPSMEPTEGAVDWDIEVPKEVEIPMNIDVPVEVDVQITVPPMPDLEEFTMMEFDGTDFNGAYDQLLELGDFKMANGFHLDDTTRDRIMRALQEQREALQRAREEQAQALQKAQEQLRKSLKSVKPSELTDEEWEMAKEQIRKAEKSLEKTMKQSGRALEQALLEKESDWHKYIGKEVLESLNREEFQRQLERIEREARVHRDHAMANRWRADAYDSFGKHHHPGKESILRRNLLEDGIIDDYDSNFSLEFKRELIKVNGIKLQGKQREKYRRLLDSIYGENSTGSLEYENNQSNRN